MVYDEWNLETFSGRGRSSNNLATSDHGSLARYCLIVMTTRLADR